MLELLGCTIAAEMGDEESLRAAAVPSGAALAEAAFYCWEAVTSEFYSGLREREAATPFGEFCSFLKAKRERDLNPEGYF